MGEIKFSKEKYDTKMGYLTMMSQGIDLQIGGDVIQGSLDSETINSLVEMYYDIAEIARYYKWSLEDSVASLVKAGEALYQADINASAQL